MKGAARYTLILLAGLIPLCVRGQAVSPYSGSGLPLFYQHYAPQDYRAFPQNWAVTQDRRGVIYVANRDGVLEYDGASWRLIPTASNTAVRSLDTDSSGTVYVGATSDFGYIGFDANGRSSFVSLKARLQPQDQQFEEVWGTHVADGGVYFQTRDQVYRWDGRSMKVWRSTNGYHTAFAIRGEYYVRERNVGLLKAEGDTLRLVPGGERFSQVRIFVMVPFGADRILIGTREEGFFLYDGTSYVPFATEADAYLRRHRLYHGCALPGGYVALATLDAGGVVILDEQGRIVQILSTSLGLEDGWVNYVYADAQGGLWMALNNQGIIRADVPSVLTRFDGKLGLEGNIYHVARYRGALYVATSIGLYRLEEQQPAVGDRYTPQSFVKIEGVITANWLLPTPEGLLVAGSDSLYRFKDGRLGAIASGTFSMLEASERYPGRVYAASKDGIAVFEYKGLSWRQNEALGAPVGNVLSLAEGPDGSVWASTLVRSLLRLRFDEAEKRPRVDSVQVNEALAGSDIMITHVDNRIFLCSENGIYYLQETPEQQGGRAVPRFVRDTHLFPESGADASLLAMVWIDPRFWLAYPDRIDIRTRREDGTYDAESPEVLRFPKWRAPVRIFAEEDGLLWIGNGMTLLRYDPRLQYEKPYDVAFPVLVRRVTLIESNRMAYGGGGGDVQALELPFADNALRFEYAAPSFNDVAETEYQYWLEGRDRTWSEWTKETSKQYTNLREGTYRFRVRARNGQGVMLPEGSFSFTVLPPWYRSWWAYAVYGCAVLALAFFGSRYRMMAREHRKAREQAIELERERIHNERLQQANVRLQEANERLKQVDRLKDEFLANTSHELRTPMTAILGFSAILKEEVSDGPLEFVEFIEENGQRLLRTLNSLLDLARLRAGTMEVGCEEIDVGAHVADVARSFSAQALRKGLALKVEGATAELHAWLDGRCFDGILYHLIGNAVKFTEEGEIHVRVERNGDKFSVAVKDTGIGIDEAFMPYLFDEFKQESSGSTRSHEGNGLGLAVAYRLVHLMHGEIAVWSRKGEGSCFTVTFPVTPPSFSAGDGLRGDGLPEARLSR